MAGDTSFGTIEGGERMLTKIWCLAGSTKSIIREGEC